MDSEYIAMGCARRFLEECEGWIHVMR
jgi:hypothetical protein